MASISRLYLPGIYSNQFLLTLEKMPRVFVLKRFFTMTVILLCCFTVFCQSLDLYLILIA